MRPAAVAGAFYPGDAEELRRAVRQCLDKASPKAPDECKGLRPRALIAPHAGYEFSGPTAGFAYKLLEGRPKPSRVILIGPSHHVYLPRIACLAPQAFFETPLGKVPVDDAAREKLLRSPLCISRASPHEQEHCLEVQLPFLQVLWAEPPPIVPIVVGELHGKDLDAFAQAVRGVMDDDTLLIASSDFTHYGRRFGFAPFQGLAADELDERIKKLDMGAVEFVDKLDAAGFQGYCDRTGATICGQVAIAALLDVLSGIEGVRGVRLHYSNSAEATGIHTDRVSYYSHAFYVLPPAP